MNHVNGCGTRVQYAKAYSLPEAVGTSLREGQAGSGATFEYQCLHEAVLTFVPRSPRAEGVSDSRPPWWNKAKVLRCVPIPIQRCGRVGPVLPTYG